MLAALVVRHLKAAAAVLPPLPGLDVDDYAAALTECFRNPTIAHETFQIAMDGTQTLPQRIFQPVLATLQAGYDVRPFAFATAMWMRYCLVEKDNGETYALRDPREAEIRAALAEIPKTASGISGALNGLPGFVRHELAQTPAWRASVDQILAAILAEGVDAAIAHEAAMN
ncbi:hypothetical protein KYK30_16085 [Shinella yambaruensis]|uniref:mannitol dehydrogenase family protein n=1 Tax=Shinella yambaruensis TaxID=415996 RepID=UPI001FD62F34|nr:hypothetical protein [Shinella yambaruensis]MCJ8027157.1 hypothetical protein [Shinella yambaruensis]MCU7981213.1 hypothetical protein [Shinella yambaruensis]